MSEKTDYELFMFGLFCGMLLMFAIAASPWSVASKANAALANCEKDIPRSHQCEITAQPKGKGE